MQFIQQQAILLFRTKTLPFWLGLALLFLTGCPAEVPIPPLPATKPKLVLFSLISPEADGLQVSVTRTVPLQPNTSNPQPNLVTDATVLFCDSRDTFLLPFDPSLALYTLPHFAVQPGEQYRLFVTAPGGFSASAQCTVPHKINRSLNALVDSTSVPEESWGKRYVLELSWQDLPGTGDYYRTDARAVSGTSPGAVRTSTGIGMPDVPLTRDENADGRKWQRRTDSFPSGDPVPPGQQPDSAYAYLLTTDRPYFDFHTSLYNIRNSIGTIGSFSDPVSLYTNVTGGFGVFAAYRSYIIGVKL